MGSRMERNLFSMGIFTIGHLAQTPVDRLKKHFGIYGELLWLNSRGIDNSIVRPNSTKVHKGVDHSITLPRDYREKYEIELVLLELTEEVCRRARAIRKAGNVVHLYCRGTDFNNPTGFSRQKKLAQPTAVTMDVYSVVLQLFDTHWNRRPIRAARVSLSGLVPDSCLQLSLFDDQEIKISLCRVMDEVRSRFGVTSLFRAASLMTGGRLFDRAKKIGGHEA
jgi:DNA polymerase-4